MARFFFAIYPKNMMKKQTELASRQAHLK